MNHVLLISRTPIYPLHSGGALAQYYFIDGLKNDFELHLCTIANSELEKEELKLLQDVQPTLRIHYLDLSSKPTFKKILKTSLKSLLHTTKKAQFQTEYLDDFEDCYFSHVDHSFSEPFINLINEVIREEAIDIVEIDFYDCIDIVFALPESVRKVFIHHEVRFKRLELAAIESSRSAEFKRYLIDKTSTFEKACLKYMDVVGVFNMEDAKLLEPYCKKVVVTPFAIPDEQIYYTIGNNDKDIYGRLLFVGGESHTPNALGLKWFLDKIYIPNLETIKMPLYIIGNWSEIFKARYLRYSKKIIFTGLVDSIEPYFQNSIFINCILTGAGLRTKVLHAFVNRVPVLSTRFGAEGCYTPNNKSHIKFFDNSEEFLDAIKDNNFSALAEKGKQFYDSEFGKEKLLKIRKDLLINA